MMQANAHVGGVGGGGDISVLRPVSIGYAAHNLTPGSRILEVVAIEHTPAIDGEVNATVHELEVTGVDPDGNTYSSKAKSTMGVPATWLPMGSNRVTPPDIRRKERVVLYRFADEDKYYWKELGLDDAMRRLETVIYAFNANPNSASKDSVDVENCYYFEMSPRTKQCTFHTSKANGEPFAYTFQCNTAAGLVTLADDANNFFELDSKNTEVRLHNSAGTYVELVKKTFTLFAPDSVSLAGVNSFNIETKVFTLAASQSATIKTASFTADTPSAKFTGDVTVSGSVTAKSMSGGSVAGDSIRAKTMYADTYQNLP